MSAVMEKKLALVGLGRAAAAYLEALPERPELYACAVVDPEAERTQRFAAEHGVRAFASTDELLDDGVRPHVAIVCSPPGTHRDVAEPLLRAGVDVLIETPLATTPDDADAIAALAERTGRVAMTASRYRELAGVRAARAAIRAGKIGRLCHLEISLGGKRDACSGWRGDPELSGGGVWMQVGPRALDVAESLAGPVERLRMVSAARAQEGEVEDEVCVELALPDDVCARVGLSWNTQPQAPIAHCVGDRGEILIGWAQTVLRDERGQEGVIGAGYDRTDAILRLLDRFLHARLDTEPAPDHGPQALAWLHAAYRSLPEGRWEIA